ncbi:MAG: hypothetical protein WEC34_13590 [Acidimicrobiia bacterium]
MLLIVALATVAGSATAWGKEPRTRKAEVLFVLEGQQAWTETSNDGELELTIAGIDPAALFFSDRPARNAGTILSSELFEGWDALDFEEDPPNAAIVMQEGPAGRRPTAVELGSPRYDAAAATVTLPLSALNGQESSWLRALTEDRAATHGTIDLFIDTSPIDLKFVNDSTTGLCVLVFQPPPDAKPCK